LSSLIPHVYGCDELLPGRHYRYLLADLSTHQRANGQEAVLRVAARLPALHAILRDWSVRVGPERLTRCDAMYQKNTDDIDRYAAGSRGPLTAAIRDLWHLLLELAESPAYASLKDLTTIHGDLGSSNVLVDPIDTEQIAIIDWESVVWGRPHADLVQLLLHQGPIVEHGAVAAYADQDRSLSLSEHWRLYRWCKLEYCIHRAIEDARSFHEWGETPGLQLSVDADQAVMHARFHRDLFGSQFE
jgi:thiamine kinase-like enzyme